MAHFYAVVCRSFFFINNWFVIMFVAVVVSRYAYKSLEIAAPAHCDHCNGIRYHYYLNNPEKYRARNICKNRAVAKTLEWFSAHK